MPEVRRARLEEISSPEGDGLVSLRLNNVDVRRALDMLSQAHGMNILIAPEVSGTVTANLQGVDQTHALRAILKLCNLVAHQEGDLVYVYSSSNVPLDDSVLQVFPLDYASAEEVVNLVQGVLSPSGQAFTTLSSDTDNRRSQEAVVVVDAPMYVDRIQQFICHVDRAPPQVMIEVHVMSVDLGDDTRHGINYDNLFRAGGGTVTLDIQGMADENASPGIMARIEGTDIDTLIDCLENTNDAKTLASPRLMVVNEQQARIQIGEQLGYKVVTVTQTAAVEDVRFLDVGVVLSVTPPRNSRGQCVDACQARGLQRPHQPRYPTA